MSHVHEGPISSYNSLHDGHLSSYFNNARIRKHLVKAGLITRDGRLVSEDQYRVMLARREHKRMIKDMISQAIVQRTLEVEKQRQAEIKKKLEEIAKLELVKRVRASRGRRGDEEVLQFLLPLPSGDRKVVHSAPRRRANPEDAEEGEESHSTDRAEDTYAHDRNFDCFAELRKKSGKSAFPRQKIEMPHWTNLDRTAIEEYSDLTRNEDNLPALAPYNDPDFRRNRKRSSSSKRRLPQKTISMSRASSLHRPGSLVVLHEAKVKSLCEVTMKFLGLGPTSGSASALHEISIDQQHCGGNTLTVFKNRLSEGDQFTFVSRRHLEFPFSLTIYVNGKVDCRLSVCCEYKHKCSKKIGGPQGHFMLQEVRGSAPCYKCQSRKTEKKKTQDDSDNESDYNEPETRANKQEKFSLVKASSKKSNRKVVKSPSKQSSSAMSALNRSDDSDQNTPPSIPQSTTNRQQVIVRLPDEPKTEILRGNSSTNSTPTKEKKIVNVTKVSYEEDKFETDDEPDDHSVAIKTPVNESVTVPPLKPQPPQTPKPQVRPHHPIAVQSPKQESLQQPSLLATLTQADETIAKSEPQKTAIVKLQDKSQSEEPHQTVDSVQSNHQIVVQRPPVFLQPQQQSVTLVKPDDSSKPSSPGLTPTISPMASPLLSPTSQKTLEQNRLSSMAKKSVSFNEVREERQISDDEHEAADETKAAQHSSVNSQADSKNQEILKTEDDGDDEDDDPNAVANHEAALAIEDQARASEDRTPFLKPDSTVLDINKQTLNDRQVRRLCAEILNSDRLEKIVIRESGLNDGMVQRICDALQHSSNSIRLLCLNLNAISAAGIVHVVQLLHAKPSIKMLLLYGNPLGDNGLNALVDGLFGDLPEELVSQLAAQGIVLPSQSEDEPVRAQLTHLDLGEIGISSAGAIKFSKLLERMPSLRVLNLGGNHGVGLEGWNAIAKSLSDKTYPAKLCLSHCRLGNKCTAEIATALRTNSGVENIDFEGCGIGEEGGRAILELVDSEPRKLENIVLTDNRIPDRLLNRIEEGLRRLRGEDEEGEAN